MMDLSAPRLRILRMAAPKKPYAGPERRQTKADYPGPEKRRNGREQYLLIRDAVLVGVGSIGILSVAFAALFVGIKDSAVALAVLGTCGTLLGLPTLARLDESRRNGR
jgi:hypothetical protein